MLWQGESADLNQLQSNHNLFDLFEADLISRAIVDQMCCSKGVPVDENVYTIKDQPAHLRG